MKEPAPQPISPDEARETSDWIKYDHDNAVSSRDSLLEKAELERQRREASWEAVRLSRNEEVTKGYQVPQETVDSLSGQAQEHENNADRLYAASGEHEKNRKVALWDAHEHYRSNKDAYHAAAIEDANEDGHDINFGGEHYPAQAPEEPRV